MSLPIKRKKKQPHRIAERTVDPFTALLNLCREEGKAMLQELMIITFRLGIDYYNSQSEGKSITLSEASRISGISEYMIRQAIKRKELNAKRTGKSKNSPIYLNVVEFNLWRSINIL